MSQNGDAADPMLVIQQLMRVMTESMRQQAEDRELARTQRIVDAAAQETLRRNERTQWLADQEAREKEQDRLRKIDVENRNNDRKASEDAILTLANQVKLLATTGPAASRSSHKLPSFDIYKDKDTFAQWRARYVIHLEDDDVRNERALTELTAALSNDTLQWIANRDLYRCF